MLVLTRKPQEVIQIGPNVKITIVRVSGQSVRIGIDAPQDVHVMRGELLFEDSPSDERPSPAKAQKRAPSSNSSRTAAILRRMKSLTDPPVESDSTNGAPNKGAAETLPSSPRFSNDTRFSNETVIANRQWNN